MSFFGELLKYRNSARDWVCPTYYVDVLAYNIAITTYFACFHCKFGICDLHGTDSCQVVRNATPFTDYQKPTSYEVLLNIVKLQNSN